MGDQDIRWMPGTKKEYNVSYKIYEENGYIAGHTADEPRPLCFDLE